MCTELVEQVVRGKIYLILKWIRATGTAYTFFTTENSKQAKDLVAVLEEAKQEIDPQLRELAYAGGYGRSRGGYGGGRGGRGGNRGGSRGGSSNRFQPYQRY
jgi:ATP-dependent RNA helicase DDX5/DBP2